MTSDKAVKVKIYPTKHQIALLERSMKFRQLYYRALCLWWNSTRDACAARYAAFCESNDDETARAEYNKTLPWPRKKGLSKEGLNDTCLKVISEDSPKQIKFAVSCGFTDTVRKGKQKGEQKNYGDVFRINALYLPIKYGDFHTSSSVSAWCKDDFARAVTTRFSEKNQKERIKAGKKPATHVLTPKLEDAKTFKLSISDVEYKRAESGRVNKLCIPFLDGKSRKKNGSDEWFDCRVSDVRFNQMIKPSAITVTKSGNEWFASISCSLPESIHEPTGIEAGIDLGLKDAAVVAFNKCDTEGGSSDSFEKYNLPKKLQSKRIEQSIDLLLKQQSRRIKTWLKAFHAEGGDHNIVIHGKGRFNATALYYKHFQSESFKRTERRLKQLQTKLKNARKDFCEQFSRKLVDRFDTIGLEDLNVKGMMKNHRMSRAISRVSFYMIRSTIERKLKRQVSLADRFAPSTQTCSVCHYRLTGSKKLKLKDRSWFCPCCGAKHDRDENAASNLRPSNHKFINLIRPNQGSPEVIQGLKGGGIQANNQPEKVDRFEPVKPYPAKTLKSDQPKPADLGSTVWVTFGGKPLLREPIQKSLNFD